MIHHRGPSLPTIIVYHDCLPSLSTITGYHHCLPSLPTMLVYHHCLPLLSTMTVYHDCLPSLPTSMSFLGAWRRKGRLYRVSCSMGALQVGPECCRDLSRFSIGLQHAFKCSPNHSFNLSCIHCASHFLQGPLMLLYWPATCIQVFTHSFNLSCIHCASHFLPSARQGLELAQD